MPKDPVFLAQRAVADDREALEVVWRQHRKWLAALVMAHMPAEAELEDILQEIAVAVVRTIGSLKNPQAIRPWLRSVAINTVRTTGRRATTERRNRPQNVGDDLLDQTLEAISKAANSGKIGDGKIFVTDLLQVIRIRTGETGEEAV